MKADDVKGPLAAQVARFAVETRYRDIPAGTAAIAKKHIVDTLAVGLVES
jgi:hypothetical protein